MEKVAFVILKKGNRFSGNHITVSGNNFSPVNRIFKNVIARYRKAAVSLRAFVPFTSFGNMLAGAVLITVAMSILSSFTFTVATCSFLTIISDTGESKLMESSIFPPAFHKQ